jgi:hypothetical protein
MNYIHELSAKSLPSSTKRLLKPERDDMIRKILFEKGTEILTTGSGLSFYSTNSFRDIEYEDSPKQEKTQPQRTYVSDERKSTPSYDIISDMRI